MGRFYPLYVRRSDGKAEVVSKGRRKELNRPTDEQLDQRPDKDGVSDFYREVLPDEPKHLDWRRKLGGMLARELEWKDKAGNENGYMLVTLPENYCLYEHVKKTERDGKLEVKNKTHAAGGNDRQDAYLYGHPTGKRKRYRSPSDFFPHLLWLATDESGNPDNCSCKICSPEDLENLLPLLKVKQDKPVKQEPESKPNQLAVGMSRTPSAQGAKVVQQSGPQPVRHPLTTSLRPTPLPLPKNPDQKLDRQYHTFMFRPGELVWFKRGQAWGLGVILRRWIPNAVSSTSNSYYYTVQPLSHPFNSPEPVVKTSDSEMRPWLAWSVPKFTNEGLNTLADPPRYESADWQGIMQRRYGNGDMEVDGSILAAKAVDATYTLFGGSQATQLESGTTETHYDGIFLGAEKIWVGEPVRLQTNTDILVVQSIVEQKKISAMTQHVIQRAIYLLGDKYSLAQAPHTNPNLPSPAAPNNNLHLPPRLTEDLGFRNARSIPMKGIASYWKLDAVNVKAELNDIKGRWYEASLIFPMLQQPQQWEETARKGEIPESSLWMNSRGDCLNSNRPNTLPRVPRENIAKETRRDAFVRAIPPTAEIRDGTQPPLPENVDPSLETVGSSHANAIEIDPRFETAEDASAQQQGGGLDEFMNLDDMDDQSSGAGFGQDFGGQSDGSYFSRAL